MKSGARILLYIFSFIVFFMAVGVLAIPIEFVLIIISNFFVKKMEEKHTDNLPSNKKCRYCMSDIDFNATVCPICRRNQSNANNPILLIPILMIVGFFAYCYLSPNAPDTAREIFCSLGMRKGYPYCYKIDTDKLNELINRYNY